MSKKGSNSRVESMIPMGLDSLRQPGWHQSLVARCFASSPHDEFAFVGETYSTILVTRYGDRRQVPETIVFISVQVWQEGYRWPIPGN